jgi:hypothetical protein
VSKSSKRRPTLLLGLLVAAGLVGAYLSDCIPGFGGGGPGEATPADESPDPATPEPEAKADGKTEDGKAEPSTLKITVEGERCSTPEGVVECASLCERTGAATHVDLDATLGSHGAVETLRKCLETAGYDDVRVRSE